MFALPLFCLWRVRAKIRSPLQRLECTSVDKLHFAGLMFLWCSVVSGIHSDWQWHVWGYILGIQALFACC